MFVSWVLTANVATDDIVVSGALVEAVPRAKPSCGSNLRCFDFDEELDFVDKVAPSGDDVGAIIRSSCGSKVRGRRCDDEADGRFGGEGKGDAVSFIDSSGKAPNESCDLVPSLGTRVQEEVDDVGDSDGTCRRVSMGKPRLLWMIEDVAVVSPWGETAPSTEVFSLGQLLEARLLAVVGDCFESWDFMLSSLLRNMRDNKVAADLVDADDFFPFSPKPGCSEPSLVGDAILLDVATGDLTCWSSADKTCNSTNSSGRTFFLPTLGWSKRTVALPESLIRSTVPTRPAAIWNFGPPSAYNSVNTSTRVPGTSCSFAGAFSFEMTTQLTKSRGRMFLLMRGFSKRTVALPELLNSSTVPRQPALTWYSGPSLSYMAVRVSTRNPSSIGSWFRSSRGASYFFERFSDALVVLLSSRSLEIVLFWGCPIDDADGDAMPDSSSESLPNDGALNGAAPLASGFCAFCGVLRARSTSFGLMYFTCPPR
mmetsp:Transcript_91488/g.258352  ORF Transcript_91488/g.258352 Transcript_91488/m.258352 type:complete len:482 (-) Transcript_91488:2234-3679(-)